MPLLKMQQIKELRHPKAEDTIFVSRRYRHFAFGEICKGIYTGRAWSKGNFLFFFTFLHKLPKAAKQRLKRIRIIKLLS